jgi:lysophospholipase L1-like esterase
MTIKNILAVGDSFTYGDELADRANAWPIFVANKLNATVDNKGIPSGGNTQIVRNIVDLTTVNTIDLVLIGWTSPGRIEFSDEKGTYDIWPGYTRKEYKEDDLHYRKDIIDYISRYHNPLYLYKQYLINIILTQTFLKAHNIKYLMMITVANEFYKNTFRNSFKELRDKIDPTYFVEPGTGMMEWAHLAPRGPRNHFLDEGHEIVANKVLDKIKQMGWS